MDNIKIDWTNFKILHSYDKHQVFFESEYMEHDTITAEEYFKWAKSSMGVIEEDFDIKTGIEIIANSKRAIDCKCESILHKFGYVKDINEKNYPQIKEYFKGESAPIITLISNLTDLNLIIVDEVRKLRNILEHEFKCPTIEQVRRAVSTAELFLLAINYKISNTSYYIEISSNKSDDIVRINLTKSDEEDLFKAQSVIYVNDTEFNPSTNEYYRLLNILITGNYKKLPALFNCNCSLKHIKYKEYYDEDDMYFDELDDKI